MAPSAASGAADLVSAVGTIPEVGHRMGELVTDDLELVLRCLPPQRGQRAQLETVGRLRSKPIA